MCQGSKNNLNQKIDKSTIAIPPKISHGQWTPVKILVNPTKPIITNKTISNFRQENKIIPAIEKIIAARSEKKKNL
jgi:hypothetical protein